MKPTMLIALIVALLFPAESAARERHRPQNLRPGGLKAVAPVNRELQATSKE
jgi:hypothetical protein